MTAPPNSASAAPKQAPETPNGARREPNRAQEAPNGAHEAPHCAPAGARTPAPPSERRAWLLACSIAAVGLALLIAALSGAIGQTRDAMGPPPIPFVAATPVPGALAPSVAPVGRARGGSAIVARPSRAQQQLEARGVTLAPERAIATRWMEGFYPIYGIAQSTFAVNWLLLASIHMQESAFSTAAGIYQGLNFAHCCGGPMQFNVTNGPVTTWDLVSDSYRYGRRPSFYNHMTSTHPSIFDDFDAIMAAAHLLSADGAEMALDASAWGAAYDYYGHDAAGVTYADEVLARAIGWSQRGFCMNCGVDESILQAVHAAWGAAVPATLTQSPRRRRA